MENLASCLQYDAKANTISCITQPCDPSNIIEEEDENEFETKLSIELADKFTK